MGMQGFFTPTDVAKVQEVRSLSDNEAGTCDAATPHPGNICCVLLGSCSRCLLTKPLSATACQRFHRKLIIFHVAHLADTPV